MEVLRLPLVFGRAGGGITLSGGGAVATRTGCEEYRSVASTVVMRSGRHFAQLTVTSGDNMLFGVLRPGWEAEGALDAFRVNGHCFYYTTGGVRCPGFSDWEGRQGAMEQGDRIGMLLDLDQGSMTVWKAM